MDYIAAVCDENRSADQNKIAGSAIKPVIAIEQQSSESEGPDPYILAMAGNDIELHDVEMDQSQKYDLNHYTQFEYKDDVFMQSQSQSQEQFSSIAEGLTESRNDQGF